MSAILRALPVLVWMVASPVHGQPSDGVPATQPATQPDEPGAPASATGPAVQVAPVRSPQAAPEATSGEYRFDALRIDGTLHGPEAMVIRAATSGGRRPLAKHRRSFLHRILETLEERCLHVQAGR
jgi:hypothetical protein